MAGIIYEVIQGMRKGKFAIAPNDRQMKAISDLGKVYAEFYEDGEAQLPVLDHNCHVKGITNLSNLKNIGFYE